MVNVLDGPRPTTLAPEAVPATPPPGTAAPLPTLVPRALLRAVAGTAGLGLAAALAGQSSALASAPAGLLSGAGVVLLTTPALVVGQQYLGMAASPAAVVTALFDAFTRAGLVALGAVPAVAWIAATSDMGPAVGTLLTAGVGAFGVMLAVVRLAEAEQRAGGNFAAGSGLGLLWAGLAALVGLRLLSLFTL